MASAQWLLNDTSVTTSSFWTAESGSSYKLKNLTGVTISRTTSSPTPYEGAGCYTGTGGSYPARLRTSADADVTGVNYEDYYFYRTSSNLTICDVTYNDSTVEYSYVQFDTGNTFSIVTFDAGLGATYRTTSAAVVPSGSWFRIQIKRAATGITEAKLFKDSNINGTTADATITWTPTYSNYQYTTTGSGDFGWIDNIKFDDTAYPTRAVVVTADAAGSATATGTAAMSNRRTLQATATGTATGTAAASNQRTLAASASATASGTAAMSSTQAMSASGSVTATGTAAANVTSLVTVDASATVTASGTASMASTQAMSASATITATGLADGSIRPLVTVDGAGTITATGATTFNKSQALAASASATASATASLIAITTIAATASVTATATATLLITTPGSLYGNAAKVAGLYGSSTKPTLTTRS
jgi:hypothetical protein